MKIKEMSDDHISNAIKYWKRQLILKPQASYMGTSDMAENSCEQEDRYNDEIGEYIEDVIRSLEIEINLRIK